MTQEEVANRIGVTPQALSKWERNQSFPDITILSDLCFVLGVSADYLLGGEKPQIAENGDEKVQGEIWNRLRSCLEPLEVIFGRDLVPAVTENPFIEKIMDLRKSLSGEGILMPLVRVRDELRLNPDEFMILSYRRILYSEKVKDLNGEVYLHIIEKLGETVRSKYAYIINPDLVKGLTDNLRQKFPVLIGETVPERISYGLLTDILKTFLERGNSMIYLEKVIEILDSELRRRPNASVDELADRVSEQLQTGENFGVSCYNRRAEKQPPFS